MALPAKKTIELPPAQVRASIQASSFDAEKKTFVVALYTGATIQRYSWIRDEVYELVLEVTPDACDLSRLKSGRAPFCLDHATYSVANSLGVFEDAWISNGIVYGRVRASGRQEFAGILEDVRAGILANVSIGADILESTWTEKEENKRRRMTAKKWAPFEGSLVSVGADPNAAVLSASSDKRTNVCTLTNSEEHMEPENEPTTVTANAPQAPAAPANVPASAPAAPSAAELARVQAAERSRVLEIQRVGAKLGVAQATIEKLVKDGTSLDQARAALIDQAAAKDDATATTARVEVGREPRDGMRASMETYLLHRADPRTYKLEDARAREYVGMTLLGLARETLDAHSIKHRGRTPNEIVSLALSTSDYPELLANVAKKTLRRSFDLYPSGWREFVRIVPVSDYKEIASISMGDSPKLLEVLENGEYKHGALTESAEKYKLRKFGRILSMSREMIVNDDMNGLTRVPQMLGGAAAAHMADLAFGILTANAALSDSVALFHATHGNLGVKLLTLAGAKEMRSKMGVQTGPNGHNLNVSPVVVMVPKILETEALQLFSVEITPALVASGNPYRGTCRVVSDPRLDAASTAVWYGAADPSQMDGIEMAVMEGAENGPVLETRNGFDVDGVEIKVRMDANAKAVEYRGLFKSAGTDA